MKSFILLPHCSFVDFVAWWERCGQWKMLMVVMLLRVFFYRYILRTPGAVPDFRDSAEALHQAMRKRGLGLDWWVKIVHVGA